MHLAAEEAVGADAAEDDVGVGDGQLGAAAPIADRARVGAGAVRTDLERADLVDPGNAAAAGADLHDVDHRHHRRMAVRISADVIALGDGRLAAMHEAGLGRGAAHVEGDGVLVAEIAADLRGRNDAADRPGFHHGDRHLLGGVRRHQAAVRLHDQQPTAETILLRAASRDC